MEGEEKHVERVRFLERAELLDLWEKIKEGQKLEPWPEGKALEYLILRAFQLEGALVVWPYRYRHEQIDGAFYLDGLSCVIECKHWREPVDFSPIAKFKLRLDRRPEAALGLMFSVSGFTWPALWEASVQSLRNVLLWSGDDMELAVKRGFRNALRIKWKRAVEFARMDYPLRMEDF